DTINKARKKHTNKYIVAILQPHTFSRTEKFLEEFSESLHLADYVYLCDIFSSARETKGELTINDLKQKVPKAQVLEMDEIATLNKYEEAVLIFMGAGD